jgi:hypothetical protein
MDLYLEITKIYQKSRDFCFADFFMDFLNPLFGMGFLMEFGCCVMYILQSAPTPLCTVVYALLEKNGA